MAIGSPSVGLSMPKSTVKRPRYALIPSVGITMAEITPFTTLPSAQKMLLQIRPLPVYSVSPPGN